LSEERDPDSGPSGGLTVETKNHDAIAVIEATLARPNWSRFFNSHYSRPAKTYVARIIFFGFIFGYASVEQACTRLTQPKARRSPETICVEKIIPRGPT
jgi:hypothetical protein